ncbi:MAG: DUF4038 domain-containing protein [Opitutaceae bacterium]
MNSYAGDNPLYAHGFLQVSADRRGLEHTDGTPFLWMGETLWGATVWLSEDGWRKAIDVLGTKRFNVLQTNFARLAEADLAGDTPWAGDRWNLDFMRKLDRMFDDANDHGIYLFVNGLIDLKLARGLTDPAFPRMIEMIAARFFAHHIGYSSSMDDPYSAEQDRVNEVLRAATRRHLLTQHAGSTDPYPPRGNMWTALQYYDRQYLDYVMVEPGGRWQWHFNPAEPSVISLYAHQPHKPIVNGEARYEGEPPAPGYAAISSADLVCYAWATFLSGGCGFTQGTYLWNARDADLAAWAALPGKAYMMNIRDFLMSMDNGRPLVPRHDLVLNQEDDWSRHMPAAMTNDRSSLVALLPQGGMIALDLSHLAAEASVRWYDTFTATYTAGTSVKPGSPRTFTSPLGLQPSILVIAAPARGRVSFHAIRAANANERGP